MQRNILEEPDIEPVDAYDLKIYTENDETIKKLLGDAIQLTFYFLKKEKKPNQESQSKTDQDNFGKKVIVHTYVLILRIHHIAQFVQNFLH